MKDNIIDSNVPSSKTSNNHIAYRNKLIFVAAITILVNVVLINVNYNQALGPIVALKKTITNTFTIIALGFFIGVFFTMIPYKKQSFDKKYLRVSLLILIALNIILILSRAYELFVIGVTNVKL